MSNQTIDGVSRELLERIREKLSQTDYTWSAGDPEEELRALLDADKVNNRQMGLVQFVEAHPIKSAAQPHGEPVAWRFRVSDTSDWFATTKVSVAEMFHNSSDGGQAQPLYAEQPAPVSVVPKSECPNCLGDAMFGCDACNDEVTRLNAKT